MNGRWWIAGALALTLGGAVIPAPATAEDIHGTLQIKGSDTMVNLCQAWAEAFMTTHPKATVAVTGGGSGAGIAAFISGTCDLVASSRKITAKEASLAAARWGAPQEWTVALDGLAVVVHPRNPVRRLTLEQLAKLFSGQIRNWRELGWEDRAVVLLSREVNSGTHVYFKERVFGTRDAEHPSEFAPEALLLPSSQAIADEVASNPAGIGYYGMGYLNPRNAVVAIAATPEGPFVAPSEETVRAGTYPITRPLFLYSRAIPSDLVKGFLEFVRSPEGQQIVRQIDFVPVGSPR